MTTRRGIVLDALDRWRAEGVLTDEEHARLRQRASADPAPALDETLAPGAGARADHDGAPAHVPPEDRSSFAVNAMQFVGGLLLGAALVALTFFLELEGAAAAWTLLGFGALAIAGATATHYLAHGRDGLEEAMFAAGLVAVAVAPFQNGEDILVGLLGMALAVSSLVIRRGDGATVTVAAAAYVFSSLAAMGPEFFGTQETSPYVWWASIVAYALLMLVWRHRAWTSAALAFYVAPLAVSFVPVMDEWSRQLGFDTATFIQLVMGAYLGIWFTIGIVMGIRGLVAGAAAGLTIDAVIFAADLGGPGTAVIVLVLLGGLLVWQAEFLRGYFGSREKGERRVT